jgi:hypothetical protein
MTSSIHRVLGAALLCGITLAASAAASPPAFAAAKGPAKVGFFIAPVGKPSLRFAAKSGETITGRVRVQNLASRSRTVRLTAADLVTADTGGASFPATAPKKVGTWLELDREQVRLAPHTGTTVRFQAHVPPQARTGEHYAGIVAVDAAEAAAARRPSKARGGVSVRHLARLALPVRLTVPGALATRLALTEMHFGVDASGSSLRVGMRNAGNQIIRETGIELQVTQDGKSLLSVRDELRDFITGSAISFPAAWRGPLRRGSYRVTGVIRPQGGPPVPVDQTVAFTPKLAHKLERKTGQPSAPGDAQPIWIWIALAVALTAAGAVSVAYVRLRRRLHTASP